MRVDVLSLAKISSTGIIIPSGPAVTLVRTIMVATQADMDPIMERTEVVEKATVWPSLGENTPHRGGAFTRAFGKFFLTLIGGWKVVGEAPNLPKIVLIGAPHTSNLDYFLSQATALVMNLDMHFVMKHSPFVGPLGALLRWLGGVELDRDRSRDFVQQMVDEFNSREQFVLAITPEGTRSRVSDWRSGFYYIATGANVPIVLVKFDHGQHLVRVGPTFYPTGDYEADLAILKGMYAGIKGKGGKQV